MGIGQRKPVKLIQIAVTIDADGRNIESNGQSFETWAEVTGSGGGRSYADGQTQLDNTRSFLIRFNFSHYPQADWKIQYQGNEWTISNLRRVDENKFYWIFTATKRSDV